MGLWLVCGTYCSRHLTDGRVPEWYVQSWPQGKKHADALIKARFWDKAEGGYQFRSWEEYQRTREQVMEASAEVAEERRRGGQKSAHVRWHVKRSVIDPNCPLCPGYEPPLPLDVP